MKQFNEMVSKFQEYYPGRIMHPKALQLIVPLPDFENTDQFLADPENCVRIIRQNVRKRVISDGGVTLG